MEFEYWWLVALLLAFFAAGALLGLAAMLGSWLSQRRKISRLERNDSSKEKSSSPEIASQPPAAEG